MVNIFIIILNYNGCIVIKVNVYRIYISIYNSEIYLIYYSVIVYE